MTCGWQVGQDSAQLGGRVTVPRSKWEVCIRGAGGRLGRGGGVWSQARQARRAAGRRAAAKSKVKSKGAEASLSPSTVSRRELARDGMPSALRYSLRSAAVRERQELLSAQTGPPVCKLPCAPGRFAN